MKKNYFFSCLFLVTSLIMVSCSHDETDVLIDDNTKSLVEPDFFENDGSIGLDGEERPEEEAPIEVADLAQKSYYRHNYTLLKPSDLKQGDVNEIKCGETKTMPLLVGPYKKKVGAVKFSNDDENLYITVKADDYKYLKKVYFYIGEKGNIPFYSNGFPNLYKFNYKAFPYYYGGQKKATYVTPLSSIDLDCFEIVAYAKVYDKRSRCYYSAFAYNKNRTQEYYYSHYSRCYYFKEWVRSFKYCKQECEEECIPAVAYHEECGVCEDNIYKVFGPSNWLERNDVHIELLANTNGCDITNSSIVGSIVLSNSSDTKLKVEYFAAGGYELCNVNFSYGPDEYNITENHLKELDPNTTSYSFEIDKLDSSYLWLIGDANLKVID